MNAPLDRTCLTSTLSSTLFIEGFARVALVRYEFSVESQKKFSSDYLVFLRQLKNWGVARYVLGFVWLPEKPTNDGGNQKFGKIPTIAIKDRPDDNSHKI